MGEFSSLLQLGVGIGIGLSLFREPLELRAVALENALSNERRVLDDLNTPAALRKRGELASLTLQFNEVRRAAQKWQKPFFFAIVLGAVVNLFALIYASMAASYVLSLTQQYFLIFVSIFYYVLIWIMLAALAHFFFLRVRQRLDAFQSV